MYLTNNIIVASLFAIASSFVNAAATSPLTAVNSQEDFCLFLPPQPGLNIRETENDSIPFCTKKDTVPKASEFPEGKKKANIFFFTCQGIFKFIYLFMIRFYYYCSFFEIR